MPDRSVPTTGGVQRGGSGGTLAGTGVSDRAPISRDATGRTLSSEPPYTGPIAYPSINQQALNDYLKRSIGAPYYFPNQATSVTPTQPQNTFYGSGDPYAILSDVFRNVFGNDGDVGRQQQAGQALVPVTSSSGGGSPVLLLLILAGVGFAVYYFYFRKKAGAS